MSVCKTCDGSGLVEPSPFHGPRRAWADAVAECFLQCLAEGLDVRGSAIARGFIRPVPCRDCTVPAPVVEAMVQAVVDDPEPLVLQSQFRFKG